MNATILIVDRPLARWLARTVPVLLIAICVLIPRCTHDPSTGIYLWAEDGPVFHQQAQAYGLRSLWLPYAGYLHLFPRIVALATIHVPLTMLPLIYFGAWLLSFLALIVTVAMCAPTLGLSVFKACVVAALIVLQPTTGEVFFNTTNSQWMLGSVLTIYLIAPVRPRRSGVAYALLIVCGLSGPFCLLLLPILALEQWSKSRDERDRILVAAMVCCAVIQMLVLLVSPRMAADRSDLTIRAIATAIVRMLCFSPDDRVEWMFMGVFWVGFGYALFRELVAHAPRWTRLKMVGLMLLAACIDLAAPLVTGSLLLWQTQYLSFRYGWIPACLIVIAGTVVSDGRRWIQTIMLTCLATVFVLQFVRPERADLHFLSYARLARYQAVDIPLNPTVDGRAWLLETAEPSAPPALPLPTPVRFERRARDTRPGTERSLAGGGRSASSDRIDWFEATDVACASASDVVVEIDVDRSRAGLIKLAWHRNGDADTGTMTRFYPAGPVKARFAFPDPGSPFDMAFYPIDRAGDVSVKAAQRLCLP